jgi:hypothetical protein
LRLVQLGHVDDVCHCRPPVLDQPALFHRKIAVFSIPPSVLLRRARSTSANTHLRKPLLGAFIALLRLFEGARALNSLPECQLTRGSAVSAMVGAVTGCQLDRAVVVSSKEGR